MPSWPSSNHDWRKVFPSRTRAQAQLAWIGSEDGVRGNAHYYTFEAGPAVLWGLWSPPIPV